MPPEGQQQQQETSMRDDFEAAIEELTPSEDLDSETRHEEEQQAGAESFETGATTAEEGQQSESDADAETQEEPDETGHAESDGTTGADAEMAAAAEDSDVSVEDGKKSKDSIKAPVGWSPKARQYWSKLPREVQELVAGREKEITEVIANTKAARQTHEAFTQLANNYAPVLAAEGVNPLEATQSLFNTVAQLRMGTEQQKAEIIAELIGNYAVDIGTLDAVLTDQPMADPEEDRLNKMFEERFGPLMQAMEGMQGMQQTAVAQRNAQAQSEVEAFAENAEFIQDVRMQMADLIDMAHARGENMSLQDAYDLACRAHPEISEIMAAREKEERIREAASSVEAKKRAASSLAGRKTGEGAVDGNLSLRDQLSNAWDNNGRA